MKEDFMKKMFGFGVLLVVIGMGLTSCFTLLGGLLGGSGPRVNSAWDNIPFSGGDAESLQKAWINYEPDYGQYIEIDLYNDTQYRDGEFDAYYKSTNVIFLSSPSNLPNRVRLCTAGDIENRRYVSGGGWLPAQTVEDIYHQVPVSRNRTPGLEESEQLDIVTVYYRVISRMQHNMGSARQVSVLDKIEKTGHYEWTAADTEADEKAAEAERQAAERRAAAEAARAAAAAARNAPQFTADGHEYVKISLLRAIGESRNSANRGKILYFESFIQIKGRIGADLNVATNDVSTQLMEFYGELPKITFLWASAGVEEGTILYRVDYTGIIPRFVIDRFK
jgi:hypothetical protein